MALVNPQSRSAFYHMVVARLSLIKEIWSEVHRAKKFRASPDSHYQCASNALPQPQATASTLALLPASPSLDFTFSSVVSMQSSVNQRQNQADLLFGPGGYKKYIQRLESQEFSLRHGITKEAAPEQNHEMRLHSGMPSTIKIRKSGQGSENTQDDLDKPSTTVHRNLPKGIGKPCHTEFRQSSASRRTYGKYFERALKGTHKLSEQHQFVQAR